MEELAVQQKTELANTAKQYIVVAIDNELFGIDIMYVDNIVRMQRITRVPKCQDYFTGVINLRGEIVPVMSLRIRFGIEEKEDDNATRIIILKPEHQTMVGIKVDQVREVVTLDDSIIEKNNMAVSENGQIFISAVGKYNDELISILNLQTVVVDKEQV